jgi:chromosome segregation ATPase
MLKNLFLLTSVSCGVGFGSTFVISRNLQQSAWAGLVTVPAVATSLTLLSRQRRQEIERQVAKSRSNLDDIRRQEQLVQASCREINAHGQKLQTGFTQLRQSIDRDQEKQAELEREVNALVLHKQKQESLLRQLEEQVTNKQNNLEKTNAELAQSESKRKSAINSTQQSELTLANIQEKIRRDSASCQEISAYGQKLQTGFTQLRQNIDRDQERQAELEREINDLVLHKQKQEYLLFQLEEQVNNKQNNLEKTNAELAQSESKRKSAINSTQQSELTLANIQKKIRQDSAIKEQIKAEIIDLRNQERNIQRGIDSYRVELTNLQQQLAVLKNRQEISLANIQEKICQHSAIKEQIKTEIIHLRNQERNIQGEIDSRRVDSTNLQQKLAEFRDQQEMLLSAIDDLERSVKDRQSLLNELDLEILDRRAVKKDIDSQTIELKEQASQSTPKEEQLQAKRWQDNSVFENNPHLQVLEHIDSYEKITESEVNHVLGNPRKRREFDNKWRDYLAYLPFSIRVETSKSGSCYVKAIITIINPQKIPEILERNAVEPKFLHSKNPGFIAEQEEQAFQDLYFDLESQSNDDFIKHINTYNTNTCRSCGSTPMRGYDYCYTCN